jgi:hypothetical protein
MVAINLLALPQKSPSFSRLAVLLFAILCLAVAVAPVSAQGSRAPEKLAPSVVDSGPFVSLEGRFSIALPQQPHGFTPMRINTPVGMSTGDAYSWNMKEGSFTAGYVDAPLKWDEPETTTRVFSGIRDGLLAWASTKNGKLISDRQFAFAKFPALEIVLDFPEGLLVQRFYLTPRRLFQLVLVLRADQRPYHAVAVKALDSFKILSDEDVGAAWRTKSAAAEPSQLPQEPVVPRARSDAEDDGLRGKVQTIFDETENVTPTSTPRRKPQSREYFNERGNLTKTELYDGNGNLFNVIAYGYIDGARVLNRKTISQAYDPPPAAISDGPPAGGPKPNFDPRYSNKITFKYDDQKRLIEKTWFLSNGQLSVKHVYKYSGNQLEHLAYTADGKLNQRSLSVLDDKGNAIERTDFNLDGSVESKYSFVYEFDGNGNWIKRTASKAVTKDGKPTSERSDITYRTIVYY